MYIRFGYNENLVAERNPGRCCIIKNTHNRQFVKIYALCKFVEKGDITSFINARYEVDCTLFMSSQEGIK